MCYFVKVEIERTIMSEEYWYLSGVVNLIRASLSMKIVYIIFHV